MEDFISDLLTAKTIANLFHFKTMSYAQHKALDEFFSNIHNDIDVLVEAYQGLIGQRITIKEISAVNISDNKPLEFIERLLLVIKKGRTFVDNSAIISLIDNLEVTILRTKYLLTFN